jgi:MFS transporter, FSR family, fosmidomycin resistance protein
MIGMVVLTKVGLWSKHHLALTSLEKRNRPGESHQTFSRKKVFSAIAILAALIFSKYFCLASLTSYYTFYLISRFHVPVRTSQIFLFIFLGAVAAGTLIGGPIGDRYGRKYVIWVSIL